LYTIQNGGIWYRLYCFLFGFKDLLKHFNNCGVSKFVYQELSTVMEFIFSSKISYKTLACLAQKSGAFLRTIWYNATTKARSKQP